MRKKLITSICLGILAVSACTLTSIASANWMVNGTNLVGTQALATTAAVDGNAVLTAAGVTTICTGKTVELTSPQIEAPDKDSASNITFTGCSASPPCTGPLTITTNPVSSVAVLGTGNTINIIFLPKTKTVLATIKFNGAECALMGTQPVTGKATFTGPTGKTESVLQEIQANVLQSSGELKVGSSAAELKGAILLQLSSGAKWSFL
jgi:hypothetical protein